MLGQLQIKYKFRLTNFDWFVESATQEYFFSSSFLLAVFSKLVSLFNQIPFHK